MTWAFGKAILLGEHAVVYGYPALAGAIDCRLRAHFIAEPGDGALRLRVPAWNLDVKRADEHVVGTALDAIVRAVGAALNIREPHLSESLSGRIDIDTELPAAAGLGSSAALSVALSRVLSGALAPARLPLDNDQIAAIANCGERRFHDNPSGVDVALATRGGLGVFVRGQGLEPLSAPPLALAVGLSGQERRTADLVGRVAQARSQAPTRTDAQLAILGAAARSGRAALERGDLAELGRLMARAHATLAELGLSTSVLDRLVAEAERAGALGAKLTGAGGGGAVIALARDKDHAQAICDTWHRSGHPGFACSLGARP